MNLSSARAALVRCLQLGLLSFGLTLAASANTAKVWVLLLQNPDAAETILSTDVSEKNNLVHLGWKLSGTGGLSFEGGPDLVMVHRMFRAAPEQERRLALGREELAANLKAGFVSEAAMGYVSLKKQSGDVAVHRFSKGDRLIWVCSDEDQAWAENHGWKREEKIFWLKPSP